MFRDRGTRPGGLHTAPAGSRTQGPSPRHVGFLRAAARFDPGPRLSTGLASGAVCLRGPTTVGVHSALAERMNGDTDGARRHCPGVSAGEDAGRDLSPSV